MIADVNDGTADHQIYYIRYSCSLRSGCNPIYISLVLWKQNRSSSVLLMHLYEIHFSTDEGPSIRIEIFAIVYLHSVSAKLN